MLEIFLEENKNFQRTVNFWPVKLANYNRRINEQILIPNNNIEVPDRVLLNKIIHGYFIDCRN
jgi:hypothetical protein